MCGQLRNLEYELRLLRKDQYVTLEQMIILPNNTKLPKIATSNPQSLYVKEVRKKMVIQNMGTAVKVTLAAQKFLKKLGSLKGEIPILESTNKDTEKEEDSLIEKKEKSSGPVTDQERQQVSEYRTALYKLTQKKELTKKEKQQKESLQLKLRVLEQKLAEQL